MKDIKVNPSNKGQSLIIVTLALFALIGMLVLIIDGGNAYLKRRQAQSAADAGALAGVRELCLGNPDLADEVAIEYAENRNRENQPDAEIDAIPTVLNSSRMRVEATITYNTFFASIFNIDRPTVWAIAEAACFTPTYGMGVLPVAWSCRAPALGYGDSISCEQQRISQEELIKYLKYPNTVQPELYIVMDSESLNKDLVCIEDDPVFGNINCDFDGDGESDWLAGNSRSWIDLDGDEPEYDCPGSSGSDELVDWIYNGYPCEIAEHTWINDSGGVTANVFDAARCRYLPTDVKCTGNIYGQGEPLVVIPVYDDFCIDGDTVVNGEDQVLCVPPSIDGEPRWHEGEDTIHVGNQAEYYHVRTFVAFHITCVRLSTNKPSGSCPGIEKARELNPDAFLGVDYKSIEGYFLEGEFSSFGGRGDSTIDTGLVTIYLDR